MLSSLRLALSALSLSLVISSASAIVPPGQQGAFNQSITPSSDGPTTDANLIAQTVKQVNQKSGAPDDEAPDADIPPTGVTAIDGVLTSSTVADVTGFASAHRRLPSDQHDASVEGTAYLTYTLVPNSTYNVDACLAWAATIDGCVFVNLYYEFNNYLLDFVFSEESNLKCVAYADIHDASEKINFGGQASYPQASGYIL
ncbi:hypothetical protein C8J57DRAFT_1608882, partial [Mycena rebaudengoi]